MNIVNIVRRADPRTPAHRVIGARGGPGGLRLAVVVILAAGVVAPLRPARTQPAPAPDKYEILRVETQWMDALERRDTVTLRRLMADDFQIRGIGDGLPPTGREGWIAAGTGAARWERRRVSDIQVRQFGDVAVVSSKMRFHVDRPGAWPPAFVSSMPVVDVWVQQPDGHWRVAARYVGPWTVLKWLDRVTGFLAAVLLAVIVFAWRWAVQRARRRRGPLRVMPADRRHG